MENAIGYWAAIAIGVLQGATEFLPVSSSGHVAIGAWLFGIEDLPLSTIVLVHGGTLIATLIVVRDDLLGWLRHTLKSIRSRESFLSSTDGWTFVGTLVASLPTALVGLLFKDHVEDWSHHRFLVGSALCVTAVVVATTFRGGGAQDRLTLLRYFLVGCAQAVAVFPGISRSGTTIAAGMLLGLKPDAAFRFSFLCSIPAVGGALLLEFAGPDALANLSPMALLAGGIAMVVGWICLLLLQRVVRQGRFWVFAVYLVPVGLGLIVWDVMR